MLNTKELIKALDEELKAINFPPVTFVPALDPRQREKELEAMMERKNGNPNRN